MRRGIAVGVMAFVALALPAGAGASSMTVTLTSDEFGTGSFCSLREAVESANANADFGGCTRTGTGNKDVILLEAGESYVRSRAGIDDTNENGDLDITGNTVFKVVGAAGARNAPTDDKGRCNYLPPATNTSFPRASSRAPGWWSRTGSSTRGNRRPSAPGSSTAAA